MSRCVLFFDVSEGHMPVIEAVADGGLTPVVHSPLGPRLGEAGRPHHVFESFLPARAQALIERESQRLSEGLVEALERDEVRRAFLSERGDFLPLTGQGFFHKLLGLAAHEILVLEALEALVRRLPMSLIVMGCDNSPVERAVVAHAARLGVPTLQLAHAIYTRPIARIAGEHNLYSDYVAVFGQRAIDIMVEYGIEPERIFPTGAPGWDVFYRPEARLERAEARRTLGLELDVPSVLYCSAYADGSSAFYPALTRRLLEVHRALAQAVGSMGRQLEFLVRPHPNELSRAGLEGEEVERLDEAYLGLLRHSGAERPRLLRTHKVESIRAADMVVAVGSSSIIAEAMILDRPVVVVPWFEQERLIYTEEDGVMVARDGAELEEAVSTLLSNPALGEEMVRRQRSVLPELNHGDDGRATQRVAALVEDLAGRASKRKTAARARERTAPKKGSLDLVFTAHNFLPYGLGGTERYTRDLAREMARRGHRVRILYPRYVTEDPRECSVREGSFEDLPVVEVLTSKNAFGLLRNEALKDALRPYFMERPPDLVHAQHLMGLSVSFVELLEERGVPFVFTANDFWFLCQQIHLVEPAGTVCSGPETMDKCVACLSQRMGGAPEEQMPQLFHYIAERYYTQKRAVGGLELVLCPSRFLMDTFLRYGFESARTIHSPQGANLFEPEERTERVVPPVVFSYLGTVDYRKGTDLAVEAFNRIETEEAELHIYGNVADQTYFNKVMQSVSPGKSVTYHGEYSAEDLPGILASTDVALVPSRGENYPFVIREILNARIPVIASAIAGIPEIVKDGVNGFLFRGNDVGDLASKMERLIKEPSLIETLREGIGPVKSIAQDAEEIEGRYLTLLGRGAESPSAEVEEPTRKKVSIIIPVYNQMEFTEKCIELLYENTPEESSFEAIVVDNASSDGTREYLESQQEDGRLRALFNEENLGFARACNQGAGAARGEYLLFLNNDTETLPGWLEPLVEILDNDPAVAAVGSKLLFPDGKIQHAGVVMARLVKEENLLSPFHVFYNEDADHPPANMPHVYQAVTAACVLIRRSSFEEVGGFDEGYWNGFEDVDLCFKFHERGWLVVYEPRSVVVHYEGQSGPDRNSRTAGNLQRLHEKWVGKVEVDVVVEPDGRQKPSGVGRVRMYVAPTERSDEMKDIPIAAVVIVTYNSASTIKACLDTVLASSTGPAEVVVVDNASTDETRAILSDYEGRITAVLNEENRGFSRACNQGIQASSAGDYVVLLNPDTAVTPGWLERMAAHFGPDVGAVGPVSSCVAANQLVSRYMPEGREGQFGIVELAELLFEANRGRSVEAKLLIGFCMMFSRKALDEVGLLDEELFLGNDDLDISWRLRQGGWRLLVATDSFVYHEGQVSFRSEEESMTSALVQESSDRLYQKLEAHYGPGNVPRPMELWGIDWFKPSRAEFLPKEGPPREGLTSIVILTHDQLDHTKLCLASIEAHTQEPHELIIVDNCSTDGTVEFLRSYSAEREHVRVVANSTNLGFAAGNNQGISLARGEYVLLLNNDTVVTKGWLGRMASVFEGDERVGVVGPVSNYVSGPQLVEEAPYADSDEMEAFAARWAEEHTGQNIPIMRVVGFCLMARRELIEGIGGLDERFGSGNFEDDDFCARAARAGYEARIAKDVFIHHTGSQTFKGANIDYHQAMLRNWELFKAKWGIEASTPMEGTYHLPAEPPAEVDLPVTLPELGESHRIEGDGRWWQEVEAVEDGHKVLIGFAREGPGLEEAAESVSRFCPGAEPLSVWREPAALNRQLDRADYLVVLSPDVVVTKPWLATMLAVAESDGSIGAVGPMSNSAPPLQSVKPDYKSLKKALQKFASKRARKHREDLQEVSQLGGFCLLLRSRAVRVLGGLDEDLPMAEALMDILQRFRADGLKLACALGAYVHNEGRREEGEEGRSGEAAASAKEPSALDALEEAQAALEQGDLESAADLFEEVIRLDPHLASAHWAFGSTLVALDRLDEGVVALRRAAKLAPQEASLQNQLGVALYQMGQGEEAERAFISAHREDPQDVDVLLNLVELYRGLERYGEAAEHLGLAQRLAPVDSGVLSALGAICMELGDRETALKALEHLEAVEPSHPEIQPLRQALSA